MSGYYVDPEKVSLDFFFAMLVKRKMLPGRQILQVKADEIRAGLRKMKLGTLGSILQQLADNSSIQRMSSESGLPEEILLLVRREARSWLVKPSPLTSLEGIPYEYKEVLKSKGIRNTADLWNRTLERHRRLVLAASTGIPAERMQEMHERCDLLRINGVGPLYARIIHHAGINSVRVLASTDPRKQLALYREAMEDLKLKSIPLSGEDIQYCIDYARIILEFTNDDESR